MKTTQRFIHSGKNIGLFPETSYSQTRYCYYISGVELLVLINVLEMLLL